MGLVMVAATVTVTLINVSAVLENGTLTEFRLEGVLWSFVFPRPPWCRLGVSLVDMHACVCV